MPDPKQGGVGGARQLLQAGAKRVVPRRMTMGGVLPARLWRNLRKQFGDRTHGGCRLWTGTQDRWNNPVTDWGKPVKVLLWHPFHPDGIANYSTTCGDRRCVSAAHNYVSGYHVRTAKGWAYRAEHPHRLVTGEEVQS